MKIGIIVHSATGNTYSVVTKLKEKLEAAGHSVNIERISPLGGESSYANDATKVRLDTLPDTGKYDALIFGAPVRGFSLSPVMAACLGQITSLSKKKVACMVTQSFPYPWMGGNRAIAQMIQLCQAKGSTVCGTGIVNWMSSRRGKAITDTVEKLASLF